MMHIAGSASRTVAVSFKVATRRDREKETVVFLVTDGCFHVPRKWVDRNDKKRFQEGAARRGVTYQAYWIIAVKESVVLAKRVGVNSRVSIIMGKTKD